MFYIRKNKNKVAKSIKAGRTAITHFPLRAHWYYSFFLEVIKRIAVSRFCNN